MAQLKTLIEKSEGRHSFLKNGIAASAHLAAITPHCPYIEFLPANLCDSLLRKELVADELKIVNGQIPLPRKPGLGIEVNMQALRKFEVGA